jgi:hypothetical protein
VHTALSCIHIFQVINRHDLGVHRAAQARSDDLDDSPSFGGVLASASRLR